MTAHSLFLEYKDLLEVSARQVGLQRHRSTDAGLGLEGEAAPGEVADYRWRSLPPSSCLDALPAEVAGAPAQRLFEAPALAGPDEERLDRLAERLRAATREEGLESAHVTLREVDRRILWWDADGVRTDRQRYAQVDLRVSVNERNPAHATALMQSYADGADVEASWPVLREAVAELARTARLKAHLEPCPHGAMPVVMPPGPPAGVFFHEVCGHPLEGDLVLRQSSYLAQRLGEAVGPEFLSVADVPGDSRGRVAYALDDEGVPARAAWLLRAGRVTEPMLDRRTAAALGLPPNGHGRRTSYRHRALPRMSHTEVQPHQGSLEGILAGVERGLLVTYLTPRHIHMLSGEFCFNLVEAREVRDGKLGAFVAPGLLRGNGLQALRDIDAVGADSANLFGVRGCGKLDQPSLPVSFGQPTVRFRHLTLEPAAAP